MMTYEELSAERKNLQDQDLLPSFMTTAGWQLFKSKYLWAKTPREQYQHIAKTAAKHMEDAPCNLDFAQTWEDAFFQLLWRGWLSPSTPVLANMGTNRGLPVSCSGQYVPDSIEGIYEARKETAILTKHGFGTAGYLGDIRGRGEKISVGGISSGVLPVYRGFISDMQYVSQGNTRRGAFATYLGIDHPDFDEIANSLLAEPDDANVGWNVTQAFMDKMNSGDEEAIRRFKKAMKVKMITGKGYFFFVDKANQQRPQMYIDRGLFVRHSQLCNEISLFNDKDHTFTCVLSSMNVALFEDWKETNAVFAATVFLDCVVSEFLEQAVWVNGLEKAVRFTEKSRALGLGACGLHTYYQKMRYTFGGLEAHLLNNMLFANIKHQAQQASRWLAEEFGEPEWCKGYGVRNTHLLAIAPTKSTALIMGGISEGINPDPAMTYTQLTAAGEVDRVNPVLLELMKERGVYDQEHIQEIVDAYGSVQGVDWLDEHEKNVFRTAFEIDQTAILRQASTRQRHVCQGQSLNLWFAAEEDPKYISSIYQLAFEDPNIIGIYYCYSRRNVQSSKGECEACQ